MTYALDNNSTVNLNGAASFLLTAASMLQALVINSEWGCLYKTLPAATPVTINGNLTLSTGTLADNGIQ